MENKNINTAKALPASASAAAEARKASCETCGYNRKQQRPELSRLCERREHDFSEAGNLGRLSIEDVRALFGSAAAERLVVSRMTADDGTAATEDSRQSIRFNLVDQLLNSGFIVTPEIYCSIMDGEYYEIRRAVIKSGKVAALDAVNIAQQYEERWATKRDRQIQRGARAYRADKHLDRLATGATVAYMATNVAAVAVSVVKAVSKLAK